MATTPFSTRKAFIESLGATCRNWTWSWSFINEQERKIIFGAWDINTNAGRALILSDDWEIENGRRNYGYAQSLEHLRLVADAGYELYTFKIMHSDERQDEEGRGPAKIKNFEHFISRKFLSYEDGDWYACDEPTVGMIPEEVIEPELFSEGAVREIKVNAYERNAQAREACIRHHGAVCAACRFDFGAVYGEVAEGLIHVHHIIPLSQIGAGYQLNPLTDLIPLCPNCHAVVHRKSDVMSIEQLRKCLASTAASLE